MCCFFFEQKTAYETRISDWSSDVCSSDLAVPEALRGRLLQLSWYDRYKAVEPSRRFELRAGSRWRFELRLRSPRGLRNPGVFDSEKTALARRVAATGYVRNPESARPLSGADGVDAWRGRMSERIAVAVPSASSRSVQALALGDTRAPGDVDWETMS